MTSTIDSVCIYQYRLALKLPVLWNRKLHSHRNGLLVCLKGVDVEGWGEIAPLPGFSQESLVKAKEEAVALGKRLQDIPACTPDFGDASPSVRFGFELAQYNLDAKGHGQLSDKIAPVACCGLIDSPNIERDALTDFQNIFSYGAVKIKVGRQSLAQDIEFVHRICQENPELEVRIDANRAWTLKMSRDFLSNIRSLKLGYIEEPLKNKAELPEFARISHVPLALDETLREPGTEKYREITDVYVLKPALSGGITTTRKEICRAKTEGKRCIISSSYESGVGMLGLIELARGIPDEVHGLDTHRAFEQNIFSPPLPLTGPLLQPGKHSVSESDLDFSVLEEVFLSRASD